MEEVKEEVVSKIVGKIFRDTMVTQSNNYFIKLKYKAESFNTCITQTAFHSIIGFLPNTKYRGKPFVLSVVYNKKLDEYEITVHNPKLKY